jgi:DNA topoisomerase-1
MADQGGPDAGPGAGSSLRYVAGDEPGIRRLGSQRFRYVDQLTGESIRDAAVLARIKSLAVPPAWQDVWICAEAGGHIQATGRDARGRKQYRYHPRFRQRRERRKFHALFSFGEKLGDLRAQIDRDLRHPSLTRERVVAAVLAILERTYVRVGNEEYARTNRSYGLTTLRSRHAKVNGSELRFCFVGKGGRRFDVSFADPRLARVVRRCQELPGQLLFQHIDEAGEPSAVSSTDVNEYLREVTGLDVTAKTFRTWGASLLAAQELVDVEAPASDRAAAIAIKTALEPVAAQLGNTITVCRASYVHPKVLTTFADGTLRDLWDAGPKRAAGGLSADERRLLAVLAS